MPQLNPVVLTDSAAAAHTFNPKDTAGGVATLVESTGVPIGNSKLTASLNETATGRVKTVLKLVVPVVQDVIVAGISRPTVVRSAYVDIAFTFDGTSNTLERANVLAMAQDLLGESMTIALVRDVQSLY